MEQEQKQADTGEAAQLQAKKDEDEFHRLIEENCFENKVTAVFREAKLRELEESMKEKVALSLARKQERDRALMEEISTTINKEEVSTVNFHTILINSHPYFLKSARMLLYHLSAETIYRWPLKKPWPAHRTSTLLLTSVAKCTEVQRRCLERGPKALMKHVSAENPQDPSIQNHNRKEYSDIFHKLHQSSSMSSHWLSSLVTSS